ncbi:hypothetical protein VB715_21745 [Crocosphaera sp. UHCC 0190]|uniref:hypothetical protein n=1 Tax=Crocosphaera sp. UHCC 0190 TaxID=3110246 RepID=UPI002B206807|nr:hypothetical protein [Crocosphaera sp. UHCC 0190]MEA5512397.1 hypothetical protein [Crocosphaera sp. UHCC 0190]
MSSNLRLRTFSVPFNLFLFAIGMVGINQGILWGNSLKAVASDMVQTIPSHNGTTKQLSPLNIPLAPGSGVSINFAPSGETIQKVWLDNPSFVVIDADGCLSGLPSSGGNCQQSNASLIYLRRINDLPIPGLPKTHQSLLTVVTKGNGGTNLYLFRITKANKASKLVFEVISHNPSTVKGDEFKSTEPLVLTTARFSRGVKAAIEQDLLKKGGNLAQKINLFLGYLESGLSKETAAQKAGISLALVNKLEALGR